MSHASLKSLAGENHLVIRGSRMKLTIIARSSDDFGVVVNSEERHKTKQSI